RFAHGVPIRAPQDAHLCAAGPCGRSRPGGRLRRTDMPRKPSSDKPAAARAKKPASAAPRKSAAKTEKRGSPAVKAAPAAAKTAPKKAAAAIEPKPAPTPEQIRAKAYELWLARGAAHGQHESDWFEAERLLAARG